MEVSRCKEASFEKSSLIAQETWLVRPVSAKVAARIENTRGFVGKEYKSIPAKLGEAEKRVRSAALPVTLPPTLCKLSHCLTETKDR